MARISKEKQVLIYQKIKEVAKQKFEEDGFEKTSTKQIAKEVGIAEGTLFNYFDSKTELFFEAFGDEFEVYSHINNKDVLDINVSEMIFEHFNKSLGMLFKIPRGVMGELAIASVRMAKRKPEKFKKFAAYDFKFMEELALYIQRLIDHDMLEEVDAKGLSEIISSVIGYEAMMYIYDHNVSKDDMLNNMKRKIDIVVKGYYKGGK